MAMRTPEEIQRALDQMYRRERIRAWLLFLTCLLVAIGLYFLLPWWL